MKKNGARSRGAWGRGAAGDPSGRPAWAWELSLPGAARGTGPRAAVLRSAWKPYRWLCRVSTILVASVAAACRALRLSRPAL